AMYDNGHLVFEPKCFVRVSISRMAAEIAIPGAQYVYQDRLMIAGSKLAWPPDFDIYNPEHLRHIEEREALSAAHHQRWDRYRTHIRVEKTVMSDVIAEIASHLRLTTHDR